MEAEGLTAFKEDVLHREVSHGRMDCLRGCAVSVHGDFRDLTGQIPE